MKPARIVQPRHRVATRAHRGRSAGRKRHPRLGARHPARRRRLFHDREPKFTTDSYALSSDKIDLRNPGPDGFGEWANASVRISVDNAGSGDVFVGIARGADVETYLAGVPHDDITSTSNSGRSSDEKYRRENSMAPPPPLPPRHRPSGSPKYPERERKTSPGTSTMAAGRSW